MQDLLFFQSLWAMQRRHPDGVELPLEEQIRRIAEAGYAGISTHWTDRATVRTVHRLLAAHRLAAEGQCFPRTVDDLKPVLENATECRVQHLDIQPDIRPRRLQECIPLLEGWRRLAEQVDFPVYVETHRDRMTTDLHFTLDLLDCFPDLRLVGDISHFVVGREFVWPVSEENQAMMRRILDQCCVLHGRIASSEQAQIEIGFAQHRGWVELFLGWWEYAFRGWRRRAGADDRMVFVCELGPPPYAITGADGNELADRWEDALRMRELVRARWDAVAGQAKAPLVSPRRAGAKSGARATASARKPEQGGARRR